MIALLLAPWAANGDAVDLAVKRLNKGEYAEAIVDLEALHTQNTPRSAVALARAYLEVGRLADAARVGAEAADKAPRKSQDAEDGQVVVALSEAARGQYKSAITRLKAVVKARPTHFEARVRLAELRWLTGTRRADLKEADAIADYYDEGDIKTAREKVWLGRALTLTEYYKNANDIFAEALEEEKSDLLAHYFWAELFLLAGQNEKDADISVKAILKKNPKHPGALVLSAMMDLSSDNDAAQATENANKALKVNPAYLDAFHIKARALIETEQYDAAIPVLEAALAINPNHPMTHVLLAATRLLKEDEAGFNVAMKAALATNPRYAEGWHTVAELIERRHRYPDAIAFEKKAIALDKEYWPAWVGLGVGLSRAGDDDEAAKVLEKAFDGDSFNVKAYNMVEHFYDGAAKGMEWVDAKPFRLRFDKEERETLEPLVSPFLRRAWSYYTGRYGFTPEKPLHVEYFPERTIFAVRTVGTPGLAAHGVCFGHVVTVASPSNADHNWAMVLWHELAHVWHHQMSKGRVPRWFTEGLAEFETTVQRTHWKREMDAELWQALENGKLKGIADFNTMFTQAKSVDEIVLAYYYATQVVRFIDGRWGGAIFARMLSAWGEKKPTPEVFQVVLGTSLQAFDADLRAWLESKWLAHFKGAFDPERLPPGDPNAKVLETLRGLMATQKMDEAAAAIAALFSDKKDSVLLRKLDAVTARAQEDWARMRDTATAGLPLDPQDLELLGMLRQAQQKLGDAAGEYRTVQLMADIQEDNADFLLEVVDLAGKNGDVPGVVEYAQRALEVAPFHPNVKAAMEMAMTASLDAPSAPQANP